MERFRSGFVKGDLLSMDNIVEGQPLPRYVRVWNYINGKHYTVSEDGERRQRIYKEGSIKHGKPLKGKLSIDDIKNY